MTDSNPYVVIRNDGQQALARAAARWLGGSCEPWRLAAVICGGRLVTPTGPDLGAGVGVAGNTSWLWAGGP
jgi:hypothetical protein